MNPVIKQAISLLGEYGDHLYEVSREGEMSNADMVHLLNEMKAEMQQKWDQITLTLSDNQLITA